MWVARKAQTIKRDGYYVDVKPGDPVPEAEHWPNRQTWVDGDFIAWKPHLSRAAQPVTVSADVFKPLVEEIPEVVEPQVEKTIEPQVEETIEPHEEEIAEPQKEKPKTRKSAKKKKPKKG